MSYVCFVGKFKRIGDELLIITRIFRTSQRPSLKYLKILEIYHFFTNELTYDLLFTRHHLRPPVKERALPVALPCKPLKCHLIKVLPDQEIGIYKSFLLLK